VGRVKSSMSVSSLIVILTLEVLACPMFSFTLNEEYGGVAELSVLPEAEASYGNAVFQKGLSYSAWSSDALSSSDSDESLRLLSETNTEWIALCFSWFQSRTTSHDIHLGSSSPTTESIKHAVTTAHNLGLKVMLKPMVEALEREEIRAYPVWRGEIQPSEEWFESYSSFINFFAEFAEQNGVELFCVGCEYTATTGQTDQWKNMIQGVRQHYSGPITYAADWTNFNDIKWWDSIDYVGIDAYFPLALYNSEPAFEELKTVWTNHADEIEEWLSTVNKPVIFTEIGYRSGDGTSNAPANYWTDMTVDLQEQRDCYEAAFQALWNRSWFYGFYWWTWTHKPAEGGATDSGHSPQNKPAQDVITYWYSMDRQVAVVDQTFASTEKCGVNEIQTVGFHFKWESDGTDVIDARVIVNGTEYVTNRTGWVIFSVAYDTVGERSWAVTDVQHPEANGYTVTTENPSIVWDKVAINVKVDSSSFGVIKVSVKITNAYDGSSVTGATTVVNGESCKETHPGIYTIKLASWSPIQQVTVQTNTAELPSETFATSTIHTRNIILYLAIIVAMVIIAVLLLKLRNHKRT
jgi:hypothetical protein